MISSISQEDNTFREYVWTFSCTVVAEYSDLQEGSTLLQLKQT